LLEMVALVGMAERPQVHSSGSPQEEETGRRLVLQPAEAFSSREVDYLSLV
jgi:hypothetical protein